MGPAGLTETTFDPATLPNAETAQGYVRRGEQIRLGPWKLGASEASGGLWSSIDDMGRYLVFALDTWTRRVSEGQAVVAWKTVERCEGGKLIRHAGALDGFQSIIGLLPDKHVGFVALVNVSDLTLDGLLDALVDEAAPCASSSPSPGSKGPRK